MRGLMPGHSAALKRLSCKQCAGHTHVLSAMVMAVCWWACGVGCCCQLASCSFNALTTVAGCIMNTNRHAGHLLVDMYTTWAAMHLQHGLRVAVFVVPAVPSMLARHVQQWWRVQSQQHITKLLASSNNHETMIHDLYKSAWQAEPVLMQLCMHATSCEAAEYPYHKVHTTQCQEQASSFSPAWDLKIV
jgi:hypothetical protein